MTDRAPAPAACPTPGCDGDARYAAPGRRHREGCTHPQPAPAPADVEAPDHDHREACPNCEAPPGVCCEDWCRWCYEFRGYGYA